MTMRFVFYVCCFVISFVNVKKLFDFIYNKVLVFFGSVLLLREGHSRLDIYYMLHINAKCDLHDVVVGKHWYIEIFRSSSSELQRSMSDSDQMYSRPSPYDRYGRGDRGGSRMNNAMMNNRNIKSGGGNDRRDRGFLQPWANNQNAWDSRNNNNDFQNNGGGNFGNSASRNFNNSRYDDDGRSFGGNNGNYGGSGNFGGNSGMSSMGGNNMDSNIPAFSSNSGNYRGGGSGMGGFGGNNRFNSNNMSSGNFGNDYNRGMSGNNSNFDDMKGDFGRGNNIFDSDLGNDNNNGGNNEFDNGIKNSTGYGALNTLGFGGLEVFSSNLSSNIFNSGGGGFRSMDSRSNNNHNDSFCVNMRGLPYKRHEMDIFQFFAPLKPVNCKIIYTDNGLPSGNANAYFSTHDEAIEAMEKNKNKIGNRYIELFYRGSKKF